MKTFFPLLMASLLTMVLGCNEGTPGGPGAKSNPPPSSSSTASRTTTVETPSGSTTTNKVVVEKPPITDPATSEKPAAPGTAARLLAGDPDNTFRLDAPDLGVSIKQGETKVVTIGISRSKNFDQDVTLMFSDLPKGITVEPAEPLIKHGERETKLNVTAAADAAVNDFTIKIIGHPATGKDATDDFKLTVQMP